MPTPKPNKEEKESEFISRFMATPLMIKEYPDEKQRSAIAYSEWKKKDSEATVSREDHFHVDVDRIDKFEITSQGFLKCPAWLTRTGIFIYRDSKGGIIKELRTPEEVFSSASLETLKLIPVTYNHPDEMITVYNVKKYQVGTTGEEVKQDGDYVSCTVLITDKDIIEEIKKRHKDFKTVELSCGYDCQLEYIGGDYRGEKYDAIQKNISYNHLSIVDRGRAGRNVKLKLDTGGKSMGLIKFMKKALRLDSFAMDAINLEYPEEAKGIVDSLSTKLDEAISVIEKKDIEAKEAQKKIDGFQAKIDLANEEIKKLKADNAELSNPNSKRVAEMIKKKTDMEALAEKFKIEKKDKDQRTLMLEILKASAPSFDAEGKSEDYLLARYDALVEMVSELEKKDANNALGSFVKNAKDSKVEIDPREELQKKCDEAFKK